MGNHSSSHVAHKSRKNVHWKSAGRPGVPGKPEIIPFLSDEEPNAITLKWNPPSHDGGAPLRGYQVECNRLGSPDWVRTAPPVVWRPELLLSGLEPPHRYQFRVTAINAVGRSDYSELSDILTVNANRTSQEPPLFLQHVENVTALENDKTEFRVSFTGTPVPTIAWFKDDYEIFSSRRTAISTTDSTSILIFHQTIASDEGEIKCTATNRAGHAVSKGRLSLEAAPKLRYPRQYEDGLLYEINETVFLKTAIVGKPTPVVEWRHDGQPISINERIQITTTPKFSMLKILSARRSDRGEYQVHAKNNIGEDTASFLVTITAPPDPPRNVSVARQVDKSVTLNWEPPEDDGGCRIGNYVVEYYRSGWNVWLKAVTSRKTSITLFDLIEGSEYRFRVKAESPYGMSAPSVESTPVKIPGRAVDMEFLAVESKIINEAMLKEGGEAMPISPTPRRKRLSAPADSTLLDEPSPVPLRKKPAPSKSEATSNEFMLVLYPDAKSDDKTEKRKSFQLDLEDALSPPPISLSAPELSSRSTLPFKTLRNAVSSTELLHERAMARFYKAVAMKEEQSKQMQKNIPSNAFENNNAINGHTSKLKHDIVKNAPSLNMSIKSDSVEEKELENSKFQIRQDSINSEKWQQMSFDEDYTASTVSTDGDYSEDEDVSLTEEIQREKQLLEEEATYNPRNKNIHNTSQSKISLEEEDHNDELIPLSPLPDPNFVPKPILKKRENTEPINFTSIETKSDLKESNEILTKTQKENKRTLFQKLTKQKPFHFPKILNKKDTNISEEAMQTNKEKPINKVEPIDDKLGDEGKTVIDYYGNIVKEYGSAKKSNTPLYLNTEDLKYVAEQQYKNDLQSSKVLDHKDTVIKPAQDKKVTTTKTKTKIRAKPLNKSSKKENLDKQTEITENKVHLSKAQNCNQKSEIKNVVLKTTERATIVIPIDYRKLEERAKITVRSAIDYTVDVCLLLLAFWLYIFKDERLAIPILILIIYRQLQETIFRNIPEWIKHYTPQWLKKKTS
ncbi:titin [Danaus plexippus]|uniref:titin n=1 Tax=Danaus plexippus TaxID=13037 RepID=UPI002AB0EE6E|nr:titin [Danaus plexippus]